MDKELAAKAAALIRKALGMWGPDKFRQGGFGIMADDESVGCACSNGVLGAALKGDPLYAEGIDLPSDPAFRAAQQAIVDQFGSGDPAPYDLTTVLCAINNESTYETMATAMRAAAAKLELDAAAA